MTDNLIRKRSATERLIIAKTLLESVLQDMPSGELIRCKDCEYGKQDDEGRWYCLDLGYPMGSDDGNGFCSDAERRTDE